MLSTEEIFLEKAEIRMSRYLINRRCGHPVDRHDRMLEGFLEAGIVLELATPAYLRHLINKIQSYIYKLSKDELLQEVDRVFRY